MHSHGLEGAGRSNTRLLGRLRTTDVSKAPMRRSAAGIPRRRLLSFEQPVVQMNDVLQTREVSATWIAGHGDLNENVLVGQWAGAAARRMDRRIINAAEK